MRTNIFLLLLFTTISSFRSWGEESLIFKQIGTQEGLSQNTVRSILVDRRGFVWAGTLDGLNRYDGTRFVTYKPSFGNEVTLSDHRVRNVYEDRNGYIWVKKYDNTFSCYDSHTESFISFQFNDVTIPLNFTNYLETSNGAIWLWDNKNGCIQLNKQNGKLQVGFYAPLGSKILPAASVDMIYEDSQRNIWIGCKGGLCKVIGKNKVKTFFTHRQNFFFRKATEVNGVIYFLTEQDIIHRYDLSRHTFLSSITAPGNSRIQDQIMLNSKHLLILSRTTGPLLFDIPSGVFKVNPFPNNKKISSSVQCLTDNKGGIWIYDHSGILRKYIPETGNLKELYLIPPQVASVIDNERYNVFVDSKNTCWITTYGNGLFRYNPVSGVLENFRYQSNANSPASNFLLSITEDYAGNIWIGSEYAGIIKVVKQKYKLEYIRPEKENSPGISNNVKVTFEDSEENVWVGTKNGSLYFYDKSLSQYRCIRKNMNPYTIIEDAKHQIWIGTKGNGIYVYDLSGKHEVHHFINDPSNANSLTNNSIFNILQDKQNRIWVASFGGGLELLVNNGDKYTFKHFFYGEGNKSYIRYLYEDRKGRIWAGSYEGLISFSPEEFISNPRKYHIDYYNANNPEGLNCNDIKTIFEDSRQRLWVGTAGGGLNLLHANRTKGKFTKFTTKQGLPSDIVTAILESRDGTLWIGTENGIARYNDAQKTFMTFLLSENTNGNYYSENAGTLRRNGDMLWGTLDGMIAFNPAKFIRDNYTPPVVLTDLYVFDQRMETLKPQSPLSVSINQTKNLFLAYNQNTFTINFSTLNLTEPSMNKYTCIMEPFEKYWSIPNSTNSATYKNLPPGKYTFRVKGCNADGKWSNQETVLNITVKPHFLKSIPAKIVYAFLLILVLSLSIFIILKITRLNNSVKIEKQLTDYKLRFFTNISHEFRTPLTLIRAAVESLTEHNSLPDNARKQIELLDRNTRQMNRLIDQLLEFRKIQNNVLTLNLELTEITDFILDVYYPFKEIASHKNIDYKVTVLTEKWEMYIDRSKVEKILFNLLSNAFKFTPANGLIELVVEKGAAADTCKISVHDTGIGIPKDKQNQLFSRFMQIHFSSEGTGVGLSLVKEFTEAHQGKVWFEENAGGGSVFCIELPSSQSVYKDARYLDQEVHHPELEPEHKQIELHNDDQFTPRSSASHEWKILIIDDNKDIRDFLSAELGNYFIIETANDGASGLERAIISNPDLIICDVKMPGMDGLQVTARLKNEFQTSHIPIILLTALSSESVELAGTECGADAYIMKPFSLRYLLSKVYKLIEQREKLKKRFSIDLHVNENLLSCNDKDKNFYELINKVLDEHLANPAFTMEEFTELCGQKRTIFYKKVKGLTGYSPNELLKIKRMKKAAELLLEGSYTVAEVSWKVGIEDQFYFSKCFKSQFGCSPSKYGSLSANS